MADALVLDMLVKFGLELMAIIRPDFFDAERKFFDDMIDEIDGIGLRVAFVDFESPHSGRIVDGSILNPACFFTSFSYESQELNVHLNEVAWNLF